MIFKSLIDYRANEDIEKAIEYYLTKSINVAQNFYNAVQRAYLILSENPFFEIRYLQYRCLPIKNFPYMLHFSVNVEEQIVQIHALINTSKNPDENWLNF